MKIIEIKNTSRGEVAYLFDEARQRVVKVLVEDMTEDRPVDPNEYELEEIPPARMPSQPKQPRNTMRPRAPIVDDGLEDRDTPQPKVPIKPRASLIPPHLRGVFEPQGSPGAATETRTV